MQGPRVWGHQQAVAAGGSQNVLLLPVWAVLRVRADRVLLAVRVLHPHAPQRMSLSVLLHVGVPSHAVAIVPLCVVLVRCMLLNECPCILSECGVCCTAVMCMSRTPFCAKVTCVCLALSLRWMLPPPPRAPG
jgi:hypothetical protein